MLDRGEDESMLAKHGRGDESVEGTQTLDIMGEEDLLSDMSALCTA